MNTIIEHLEKAIALRAKETGVSLDEDDIAEFVDYLIEAIDNAIECYDV